MSGQGAAGSAHDEEDFDEDLPVDDETGDEMQSSGKGGRLVNLVGALVSLGLIGGMAVWGYNLAVRDVTGVPVMRAQGGALRVAPENPGGEETSNQGLSVNAVAASGVAAPLPDQVVLAPRPVDLDAKDAPGLETEIAGLSPEAEAPATPDPDVVDLPAATVSPEAVDAALSEALGVAVGEAAAPQPAPGAEIVAEPEAAEPVPEAVEPSVAEVAAPLATEEAVPALAEKSDLAANIPATRPQPRPQALGAGAPAPVVEPGGEVDPASIAPGTRLVQLGAFDDAATARGEWAALKSRFSELMADKSLVVQPAESGGRTFFRLRAFGFEGEDDARRFCAALLAENAACIPVAHR